MTVQRGITFVSQVVVGAVVTQSAECGQLQHDIL